MNILTNSNRPNSNTRMTATIGMFDGVHLGHELVINFLKEVATKQNQHSAVITFSQHPQTVLRKETDLRLIMKFDDKLKSIDNLGIENAIVINFCKDIAMLSSYEFMEILHRDFNIDTLIIGYDHKFGHDRKSSFEDYVAEGNKIGIKVIKAPEYTGDFAPISSSKIRKQIAAGNVNTAAKMLNKYFQLEGTVVHGFKNGRKIGFPTANLSCPDAMQIVPTNGVYAVKISIESGEWLNGICNIGNRPTIHSNGNRSIETHILDFDEDIYGKQIRIRFLEFIRAEEKFDSIELLVSQIESDKKNAIKIFTKYNK